MIEFAQVHPIWFGIIWTFLACALAAAIGAIFGAIANSLEGGDAADGERG